MSPSNIGRHKRRNLTNNNTKEHDISRIELDTRFLALQTF